MLFDANRNNIGKALKLWELFVIVLDLNIYMQRNVLISYLDRNLQSLGWVWMIIPHKIICRIRYWSGYVEWKSDLMDFLKDSG